MIKYKSSSSSLGIVPDGNGDWVAKSSWELEWVIWNGVGVVDDDDDDNWPKVLIIMGLVADKVMVPVDERHWQRFPLNPAGHPQRLQSLYDLP